MAIFVFGVNFTLWGTAGLARAIENRLRRPRPAQPLPVPCRHPGGVRRSRVAVLMAAHNEEIVIADSLAAITRLVRPENVHVVSDGSTDRTVEIALACGVNVTETPVNVGKAGALEEGVRHFSLATRFDAVLLLDADTRLDPGYFDAALPEFDDPAVVAVAGCAATDWSAAKRGFAAWLFTAHRSRIYAVLQRLLKFGQTWHRTNATPIVPGFASLYRAHVLPRIDINPPGLVIEDFNMTFEVYRRRLGKVGFSLRAVAVTQDPDSLRDYVRQTRRWALGFWQTVRRFRPRADLFTAMLGLYLVELVLASVFMALLPFVVVLLLLAELPGFLAVPVAGDVTLAVGHYVNLPTIAFGILLPDVILTVAVALTERRARYLLMAPFYLPLRCLDAFVALWTLPRAWLERSTGRWQSPSRRAADASGLSGVSDVSEVSVGAPGQPLPGGPQPHQTRGPRPRESHSSGSLPHQSQPSSSLPHQSRPSSTLPGQSHSSGSLPHQSQPNGPLPRQPQPSSTLPGQSHPNGPLPHQTHPSGPLTRQSQPSGGSLPRQSQSSSTLARQPHPTGPGRGHSIPDHSTADSEPIWPSELPPEWPPDPFPREKVS
ncbi:glycosyltransferase family 2 protein [Amycolatopsis sp. FDAARGOS 1241]|uniref:glycosyltransferase n=1 Tax=Amycolatopsis sp. FDAARGOS 1241 TaxID=2778070 RepID=UPI002714DC5B|nr:glycosyltransferase [Amycolatopsis sp. FDAARGOS 1241]